MRMLIENIAIYRYILSISTNTFIMKLRRVITISSAEARKTSCDVYSLHLLNVTPSILISYCYQLIISLRHSPDHVRLDSVQTTLINNYTIVLWSFQNITLDIDQITITISDRTYLLLHGCSNPLIYYLSDIYINYRF